MNDLALGDVTEDAAAGPFRDKIARGAARQVILFKKAVLGCSLHAIYDDRANFLYAPVPKAACSSILNALIDYFRESRTDGGAHQRPFWVHRHFLANPRYWVNPRTLAKTPYFKFTVVRDPLDRFVSGYRNRIIDNRDLAENADGLPALPDMDFFATHLRGYCEANGKIDWHFRPQTEVIGDPAAYDRIYDISELDELYTDLKEKCGVELKPYNRNKSRAPKPAPMSSEAMQAVFDFYRADYDAFAGLYARKYPNA